MLSDWRFWACFGVGLLLAAWLFPVALPFGEGTALVILLGLLVLGYELGRRLIP